MKIQLKQFYQLSSKEKIEHVNELKKIPFIELEEYQKAIVYHWYQNWMLEGWPIPKKNFISIGDN